MMGEEGLVSAIDLRSLFFGVKVKREFADEQF